MAQHLSPSTAARPRLRHDVRPELTGWTVYDATNGQPVRLDGTALIDLAFEEAEGLARLLNWQEREIQRAARRLVLADPKIGRVLGQHRSEVADLGVSREAREQGDADVHHALGIRDDDRAPAKPRQPMPLAGVVPLDAMRLLLARIELSNRQEHARDGVVVRAVEPRAPALQAFKEALTSGFVATAAFPVHQLP